VLKTLGGYRQELEWVPFFFFGYLFVRSKRRLRKLFLLLGVIALANGDRRHDPIAVSPASSRSGARVQRLVKGVRVV